MEFPRTTLLAFALPLVIALVACSHASSSATQSDSNAVAAASSQSATPTLTGSWHTVAGLSVPAFRSITFSDGGRFHGVFEAVGYGKRNVNGTYDEPAAGKVEVTFLGSAIKYTYEFKGSRLYLTTDNGFPDTFVYDRASK